jgi:NAD(P)-dependent dehydrogenase (short-subunit alcohol dehydrogenase family)
MNRLSGKVALVTGAGGGIGSAICKRFVQEGAKVLAVDISGAGLEASVKAAGGNETIVPFVGDITNSASVKEAVTTSVQIFGKLDTLCNTAGGSTSKDARVTEAPEEEFWRAIKLDLFGTFLCCKHAIPEIARSGGGSIVNFSSMVALMALAERDCYTAAKGGVASLTRSMAYEYASDKIRVNAIAPGLTLSQRVLSLIQEREELKRLANQHLLGVCEPDDMAHLAVYLASDESRVVTGQIMSVDSGVTIH